MTATLPIAFALTFLALTCATCEKAPPAKVTKSGRIGLSPGDTTPDYVLQLRGETKALSTFRGKVVLLHFWATWCPPCVEEFPSLKNLRLAYWGKSFEIVAVSVDEGGFPDIDRFLKGQVPPMVFTSDPASEMSKAFRVFKYPESYLLDANGMIVEKIIGPQDWLDAQWQRKIDALLD